MFLVLLQIISYYLIRYILKLYVKSIITNSRAMRNRSYHSCLCFYWDVVCVVNNSSPWDRDAAPSSNAASKDAASSVF